VAVIDWLATNSGTHYIFIGGKSLGYIRVDKEDRGWIIRLYDQFGLPVLLNDVIYKSLESAKQDIEEAFK
jgi:hypothetical protein